jgi:hypothetical protein
VEAQRVTSVSYPMKGTIDAKIPDAHAKNVIINNKTILFIVKGFQILVFNFVISCIFDEMKIDIVEF